MSPATASDAPLVQCDGVSVDYATFRAVNRVSVSCGHEEVLGLVGESGSGKSTLARTIVGLTAASEGTVTVAGLDLSERSRETQIQRGRLVGMIFQDPRSSLNPRLSIEAALREPLRVHGIGDREDQGRRIRELLTSVGLPEALLRRRATQLSGGQLQRVAIARAIALDQALIIADEPTSALDVSVQAQILNLLRAIRSKRHLAMILISHDIRAVRFLADRMAVMRNGEVVETGPTERVCTDPQHPYTRSLLAAVPRLRGVSSARTR